MGLINRLFKRQPPVVIDDPVFGRLKFDGSSWSTDWNALPLACTIGIVAGREGPSQRQREFFGELEHRWAELNAAGLAFVRANASEFELEHADMAELAPYALVICSDVDCDAGKFTIEYTDSVADVVCGAGFKGGVPAEYYADD